MTGQSTSGYSTRHASYDLRKIRGNTWSTNLAGPAATTSHPKPPAPSPPSSPFATRSIAPIIAGVRSPRKGSKPITWTPVDRDYETLRIDLQTLFTHLGITTNQPAAA